MLATTNSDTGVALGEELARRLGRERCWQVKFDPSQDVELQGVLGGVANEVLVSSGGAEKLRQLVQAAERTPIKGLKLFSDYEEEITALYNNEADDEDYGLSTGWDTVDAIYKVVPGELTVVTGVPNSGKSEWIDALTVSSPAHSLRAWSLLGSWPCDAVPLGLSSLLWTVQSGLPPQVAHRHVLHGESSSGPFPQARGEAPGPLFL